jgi:hypothetical protein
VDDGSETEVAANTAMKMHLLLMLVPSLGRTEARQQRCLQDHGLEK